MVANIDKSVSGARTVFPKSKNKSPNTEAELGLIEKSKKLMNELHDEDNGGNDTEQASRVNCKHCDKKFVENSGLNRHMREQHKEEWIEYQKKLAEDALIGDFECNVCEKVFKK